jgi:hypothetical protein
MLVLAATTVPLNRVHVEPLTYWGGSKSTAVDQLVEALGLTRTRQVAELELPRIQPEMM